MIGRSAAATTAPVRLGGLAAAVGKGLAAGLAGTAVMTVSSTVEAKLRGRESSTTPARAASAVLGVAPVDERGEQRFNNLVHWGYGTAWGAARGVLGATGLDGARAAAAHLAAVWGTEQVVLPATGAGEPATTWAQLPAGDDGAAHGLPHGRGCGGGDGRAAVPPARTRARHR